MMSYSQSMNPNTQDVTATLDLNRVQSSSTSEVNHTRGGYIYKIVNSLLISKPEVFAKYLLDSDKYKQTLIQNSQCKSIAMILVTLLTLPQQTNMNNNMMATNTMNFAKENITQNNDHLELMAATKKQRINLLSEIVSKCIDTMEEHDLEDLHNNFCYVINNLFLREFADKKEFVNHILVEFYDTMLQTFLDAKVDNIGNKLGVVLLSLTGMCLYFLASTEAN